MHAPGDLAHQLERLRSQRPHLQSVLPGLEQLLEAAADTAATLAKELPDLPAPPTLRDDDLPVLGDEAVESLAPWLAQSARSMAAAVTAVYDSPAPAQWLLADDARPLGVALALLHFDGPALAAMAQAAGMPVDIFALAARDMIAPVFVAVGQRLAALRSAELRGKGWCPVCGQNPCLATLGTASFDTSFLATSGGQRSVRCSLCDTSWRVSKGLCPACGVEYGGEEHPEGKQILHVEGQRHERLEWCTACTSYIPCLDLREMDGALPGLPVQAALFALMHLDVAAKEQGLTPVTPTVFNALARSISSDAESAVHEIMS